MSTQTIVTCDACGKTPAQSPQTNSSYPWLHVTVECRHNIFSRDFCPRCVHAGVFKEMFELSLFDYGTQLASRAVSGEQK